MSARLALAALLAALAVATPATAEPWPPAWRGVWAVGGCAAGSRYMVLHGSEALYAAPDRDEVRLERYDLQPFDEDRRAHHRADGGFALFGPASDQHMVAVRSRPGQSWRDLPAIESEATREVYERCPYLPPSLEGLHGEAASIMAAADAARADCADPKGSICPQAMFTVVDVSGNGEISAAELARAIRYAAWRATFEDETASAKSIGLALTGSYLAGPVVAAALVASLDYDDSGELSVEEITVDRPGLVGAAREQAGDASGAYAVVDEALRRLDEAARAIESLAR